jgi:AMP deaminase
MVIHFGMNCVRYTIAQNLYQYSTTELVEIARNSVIQSGLDDSVKQKLLGKEFKQFPLLGCNNPLRTNLPQVR